MSTDRSSRPRPRPGRVAATPVLWAVAAFVLVLVVIWLFVVAAVSK